MGSPETTSPGTPAPAQGGVFLNGKTLLQALAFAGAGVLGGGGVSIATTPATELSQLKSSVDAVALTMHEIRSDLKHATSDRARMQEQVKDLELRMRQREACICGDRE